MSTWDLKSVLDVPRYLLLKFGENRVIKSWDIRWGVLFFLLLSLLLGKVMPTLVQLELNCRLELSLAKIKWRGFYSTPFISFWNLSLNLKLTEPNLAKCNTFFKNKPYAKQIEVLIISKYHTMLSEVFLLMRDFPANLQSMTPSTPAFHFSVKFNLFLVI